MMFGFPVFLCTRVGALSHRLPNAISFAAWVLVEFGWGTWFGIAEEIPVVFAESCSAGSRTRTTPAGTVRRADSLYETRSIAFVGCYFWNIMKRYTVQHSYHVKQFVKWSACLQQSLFFLFV